MKPRLPHIFRLFALILTVAACGTVFLFLLTHDRLTSISGRIWNIPRESIVVTHNAKNMLIEQYKNFTLSEMEEGKRAFEGTNSTGISIQNLLVHGGGQNPSAKSEGEGGVTFASKDEVKVKQVKDTYYLDVRNSLIDDYGKNNLSARGELGRGVTFGPEDQAKVQEYMEKYKLNVLSSDVIPLNRMVPDSRLKGCQNKTWDESSLPNASVIIPFHDEWLSILLRTVYSVINRTPRSLLQEVLLLDDASTLPELKAPLDEYVKTKFPMGLVRLIRAPERVGLIHARQEAIRQARGQVVVIFDSHMEVNIDWLQPLLQAIKDDRKTVAMSTLDYIQSDDLKYTWKLDYSCRYGFNWKMVFFESYFREDTLSLPPEQPKPGVVMVGAAFAMDRQYFWELGGYDTGMKVWGGENLEMAWRVYQCGGRLLHVPCSKIGHIARAKPYNFPGGASGTYLYNYKRAVEVWMEPEHKFLVYNSLPELKDLDVGDLSERLALRQRLQCQNFSWYLNNVWPELFDFYRSAHAWGNIRNLANGSCLDNDGYLFTFGEPLFVKPCVFILNDQGFSWTTAGLLRTTLQCVVVKGAEDGTPPVLESCFTAQRDVWTHKEGQLKHQHSQLCLDLDSRGPVMKTCRSEVPSQRWAFTYYNV